MLIFKFCAVCDAPFHGEKEPKRGDGGVDRPGADLLLRHMQLKAAKIVARRRVRRPAEEGRKGPDMPKSVRVASLNRRAVMSSIKRCLSGLMGLADIAKAPVSNGVEPHDLETGLRLSRSLQTIQPSLAT
jgi:hypothetical protein